MAPEVFQQMYGMKADIWSVGCVAVQMATGNPPWKQLGFTNPVALFQHMISTKGAPMMELEGSPGLADGCQQVLLFRSLVETCFERQPEGRPTAGALLVDSFFAVEMGVTRDDNSPCRGLFSPESTGSSYYSSSPFRTQQSPLRPPTRRRNSRSSSPRLRCFSPPLPRSKTKRRQSQSPLYSPCRDASDWPTWAQRQLPFVGDASAAEDVPGESKTIKTLPTSDSFDSLVYSDDSGLDASGVSLVGLKFASTVSPQGDAIEVPGIERTGTTVGAASSKVVAARQT
jgi:serine/threonine protein kinase